MVAEIAALDLWTLFVNYTFGSFWVAVIGLMLVMFIIMGVLGRISIYSVMWYNLMFLMVMTLGYGFMLVSIAITVMLLIGFLFSWSKYFNN